MADGSSASKPAKSELTRRAILEAAARLFRQRGYAAVSLRDIAEAVGMKTGSLYYHFPSKESLVEEILALGTQGAMEASQRAAAALGPDADPVDKLEAVFLAHTQFLHDEADFASANLKILGQVPPEIRERHVRQDRAYGAFVAGVIEEIDRAYGLAPGIDPSVLRMLCFGAMNWSISWFDPTGSAPGEIAAQLMTMVRRGALADAQSAQGEPHVDPRRRDQPPPRSPAGRPRPRSR